MRIQDLIEKKKKNEELTKVEIDFFIKGYVDKSIADYQVSALLMAIYFNSMTSEETANLTNAMVNSGEVIDLTDIKGIKVDKHSTGGVADTTSLILAPIVAACGAPVCKMSGRGLGHTGGTLDKLESIPGFNVEQSIEDFKRIIATCGLSIIGQSANLAPADKKMYALRDVTGTVNSIPLIASSIMSKKIAAGCDGLVLDVKVGSGSFMGELEQAEKLATSMVNLGHAAKKNTRAILSDMNQPLGKAIGNSLEVIEAIDVLKGSNDSQRLKTVAFELGANMLEISGIASSKEHAFTIMQNAIEDGSALNKLKEMVVAQGGNPDAIDNVSLFPTSKNTMELKSVSSGYIHAMDTASLGKAASILGAGRIKKDDEIDLAVGYIMECQLGDYLDVGDVICEIHYNDDTKLQEAVDVITGSITLNPDKISKPAKLIYEVIK